MTVLLSIKQNTKERGKIMANTRGYKPATVGDAVEMYIDSQDKSTRTVKTIRSALTRLLGQIGADLLIENLASDDLIYYRQSLADDGLAFSSTMTYMSMVRSFFKWLILRQWAGFDMEDLERAVEVIKSSNGRKPAPLPKLPDEDAVKAIIREVESATARNGTDRQIWAAMRNAAMLHVLRSTGVRVQELVDIRFRDVHLADSYIVIPSGKGEKERYVILDDNAQHWLAGWAYEHPDGSPDSPVFIRLDHRLKNYHTAMSTESVRKILRAICEDAGVKRISPHQFRHRFGTAVYVAAGLGAASDLLGHSDTNVTRVYAKLALSHMKGIHAKAEL